LSNYTQTTNFATKDALASGNPLKIVKGTEINVEFANIATAVATKADTASPTFTGTATFASVSIASTMVYGGVTLTAAVTGTGKMVLDTSPTLITPILGIATATSINKLTLTTPATSATLTVADGASLITSGAYSLTLTTTAATNVTFPTTGTLATLAGSETFTNKTLTSPTIGGTPVMNASVITRGTAVASTSGTSIDFTSIPSWVKRITVIFNEVSLSGTTGYLVQLGTGGTPTYTTSGYVSTGATTGSAGSTQLTSTAGMVVFANLGTQTLSGAMTLTNITGNTWINFHSMKLASNGNVGGGSIALAAALTAVRITTVNGTDTFDAGSINILYE